MDPPEKKENATCTLFLLHIVYTATRYARLIVKQTLCAKSHTNTHTKKWIKNNL